MPSADPEYLEPAMTEMSFSARAHDRILKAARTLTWRLVSTSGVIR